MGECKKMSCLCEQCMEVRSMLNEVLETRYNLLMKIAYETRPERHEDLLHDAIVKLLAKHRDLVFPHANHLTKYLERSMYRLSYNIGRTAHRYIKYQQDVHESQTHYDGEIGEVETRLYLDQLVDLLPNPIHKQVLSYKRKGYIFKEIHQKTKVSKNTLMGRFFQAKNYLNETLGDETNAFIE